MGKFNATKQLAIRHRAMKWLRNIEKRGKSCQAKCFAIRLYWWVSKMANEMLAMDAYNQAQCQPYWFVYNTASLRIQAIQPPH